MRVLMINKYARVTGGADKQCISLAASLREDGHEVAFLATASPENVEAAGSFVHSQVSHETRDRLSARERAHVLALAVWNREAAAAMDELVRDFEPDVVHAHKLYPHLSVSPIRVARRRAIPIVQTLHDYEFLSASPFDATGGRRDRREQRFSYRVLNTATYPIRRSLHAPAVTEWIAVSEFVAGVHRARGIRPTVVVNFADRGAVEEARPPDEREGILFLGVLSEEKGVLDLLRAAQEHRDLEFVIAGPGPLRDRVIEVADASPNIDFKGRLEPGRAAEAIASARLLVVPSRWEEPGSLVALEAMAAGTPVVAYRRGGLGEYVVASGAGVAIDSDWRLLGPACRQLLDDDDRWLRCATAGLDASRTMFSRATHTKSVVQVYERARRRARD